jgi:translin
MKDISGIISSVNERMDRLEKMRERSIASSRSIIRMTKKAIHSIHLNEDHEKALNDAVSMYNTMICAVCEEPEILLSGPVCDAMMELSEACILSSVVSEKEIPSYTLLNVSPQAWVMGLADALGEMRRILLAHLMRNEIGDAKRMFDNMEVVCDSVMSFDTPDAILPIRRKQDVARSLMERTRTDITNALVMKH